MAKVRLRLVTSGFESKHVFLVQPDACYSCAYLDLLERNTNARLVSPQVS